MYHHPSRMTCFPHQEQQSLEFEIQYQLKKPIEDLELKRVLSLPTLTHIPTACLTSTAFAQVQVVYEFIAAFSEFLGFGEHNLYLSYCCVPC